MTMEKNKHIHDRKLEREKFLTGELNEERNAEIEEHLLECATCRKVIQEERNAQKEVLNIYSFEKFTQENGELFPYANDSSNDLSLGGKIISLFGKLGGLKPVMSLATLLVVISVVIMVDKSDNSKGVRYKGDGALSFIHKNGESIQEGDPLQTFGDGDEIQVIYSGIQSKFITLISIDSKKTISFYKPFEYKKDISVTVESPGKEYYPKSILLDDSKGYELVCALLSDMPLNKKNIIAFVKSQRAYTDGDIPKLADSLRGTSDTYGVKTILLKKR